MILKLTSDNFDSYVTESDVPVLVDFYADWCGPCKMMAPVVETLDAEYEGRVKFAKVDIDASDDIAMKYGIMSIPTFIVFKNGDVKKKFIGVTDKKELAGALDENL